MLPQSQSYANLSGELTDYEPVIDPTTDLPSESDNETRCDVAQMTRTANRCYVTFTDALVLVEQDANWAKSTVALPVPSKVGTGHYTITWPATVFDERGISRAINLRRAAACCEDAGYSASAIRTSPNTADVFITRISTAALANPPGNVNVWAW